MLQSLTTEQQREVLGRLYLWHSAVSEVCRLLDLADRAWGGRTQPNIVAEQDAYDAAIGQNVPFENGAIRMTDLFTFDARYPRPFPILTECYELVRATRMLAVIVFGQIVKSGDSDIGRVSRSTGNFMDPYRVGLEKHILSCGVPEQLYQALVNEIELYRDKMLAHADGAAFGMTHGHPVSSFKMVASGLETIDFGLLRRVSQMICDYLFEAWQPLLGVNRSTQP